MQLSTLEHDADKLEPLSVGSDQCGSYAFAIAIILLSLIAGAGLGAAYLKEQSPEQATVLAPT
jgi:hypothetical protein